jgi:hypothetical protein
MHKLCPFDGEDFQLFAHHVFPSNSPIARIASEGQRSMVLAPEHLGSNYILFSSRLIVNVKLLCHEDMGVVDV